MNYNEFLEQKKQILNNNNVIDMSENNLYKFISDKLSLSEMSGKVKGHVNGNVHRCHLVEDWLKYFNLPEEFKKYIGVSNGVRHSLDILMEKFQDKKWYIPQDVYPVYKEKANSLLKIDYKDYKTLVYDNVYRINGIPEDIEIILTINPFKPYGRKMLRSEINTLRNWLNGNKERRLVIDCVYMLSINEYEEIFKLFDDTQQVYLLFSLSKTWLIPNVIGFTFIPEHDLNVTKEIFKNLNINKKDLNLGYLALNKYKDRPELVKQVLRDQINIAANKIKEFGLINDFDNPGYLFYSNKSFDYWSEKGFLTIPATVFGGKEGVIISTLIK